MQTISVIAALAFSVLLGIGLTSAGLQLMLSLMPTKHRASQSKPLA